MIKYSISIKWSDEDNGFIAFTPELPGLSAFGETPDEAVAELQVASEAFLESLKDANEELPAPNKLVPYSGQTRLRVPKRLHADLALEAENEGVSLNTYIISLLAERHQEKETVKLLKEVISNLKIQKYPTVMVRESGETLTKYLGAEQNLPKSNKTLNFLLNYDKNLIPTEH